jgi:hypothetical protein
MTVFATTFSQVTFPVSPTTIAHLSRSGLQILLFLHRLYRSFPVQLILTEQMLPVRRLVVEMADLECLNIRLLWVC